MGQLTVVSGGTVVHLTFHVATKSPQLPNPDIDRVPAQAASVNKSPSSSDAGNLTSTTFDAMFGDMWREVNTMSDSTIERLLGGKQVIGHSLKTEMDLYEASRTGLPKLAFLNLVSNLNVSMKSMAQLLNVAERTIQRKGDDDLFDISTSEQILQIAEVYSRGQDVFESLENFRNWMNSQNMSLGGKKPIELLPSRYGAQMILDVIGRIEHGVYS